MNKFIFSIVIISILLSQSCKKDDPESIRYELPELGSSQIIMHEAYTLSYNEQHEQADWVAYELTKAEAESESVARTEDFRPDPEVTTGSATYEDYTGSGYDRGHLIPAADNKWSETAMSESFFMSNISPQNHDFNAGKWLMLENQVREWAKEYNHVYVAVGGILTEGLNKIGTNGVSVPEYFYKVVLDYDGKKAIGFILPNINLQESFKNYAVSIDSIERLTGIDFFERLPDDDEEQIESTLNLGQWSFSFY